MGFPIRKSSDHRVVVTSPRLIADSYVLHRLLVPRHSPCALNNLGNTTKTHCLQRCSRPLCSSQRTTPHHHQTSISWNPVTGRTSHTHHRPEGPWMRMQPQNPIACLHLEPPQPTDPRSMRKRSTGEPCGQEMKRPFVDVPPMSNHPYHMRARRWPPILV